MLLSASTVHQPDPGCCVGVSSALPGPAVGLCPLVVPVGAGGSGSGGGGRLSAQAGRDVMQSRVRGRCSAEPGRGRPENSSPSILRWLQFSRKILLVFYFRYSVEAAPGISRQSGPVAAACLAGRHWFPEGAMR
jgi:hypothetical protein